MHGLSGRSSTVRVKSRSSLGSLGFDSTLDPLAGMPSRSQERERFVVRSASASQCEVYGVTAFAVASLLRRLAEKEGLLRHLRFAPSNSILHPCSLREWFDLALPNGGEGGIRTL